MAHCEFCDKETSNENIEEIDGAIVRVCDDCIKNPQMGGALYAAKIEREQSEQKWQRKSFDPTANWLAELNEIQKQQEAVGLVDENALLKLTKEIERVKNAEAEMKTKLLEIMQRKGVKSLKTQYFTISLTDEHTTKKFDQKAFKDAHSELYAEFEKPSVVKASVRITLKKNKE